MKKLDTKIMAMSGKIITVSFVDHIVQLYQ